MQEATFHHNFNLFLEKLELNADVTGHKAPMELTQTVGKGTIRRCSPRLDMELVVSDYTFHQRRTIDFVATVPMVELTCCFRGGREVQASGVRHEIVPGHFSLQLLKPGEAHFEFTANEQFTMLGIGIPVSTFHYFMEEPDGRRSVDFADLLGPHSFRAFQARMNPVAVFKLTQLMQGIQSGSMRNIEMECAVLDLWMLALRTFFEDRHDPSVSLNRDEIAKIKRARQIMLEHMAEPPSLLQLSHMIGMNDYKLKMGYKEMYGTTVFGDLREQRLDQALHLLQVGGNSVTEVSCAVGYSNPSYFAEAFRKKYGCNPGTLVRNRLFS
ncbi:AraC family transcriptional regulator (plasmid) [Paenibacillus sp. IHB B 3084]|uniref:helix-turn-helix transcriptional regulator n=1 Tax=Paenibacillus sp. IHB B 3084 TaxID=867076 RepID=UPI00071EBF15|nr:AraC family transcriptional regulator [Paenibacillus sp. IHB B 3084]ALP39353.1 AraC family transcriptional regulator [Paenibacillus sp. IHB B 3084]